MKESDILPSIIQADSSILNKSKCTLSLDLKLMLTILLLKVFIYFYRFSSSWINYKVDDSKK